MIYNSVNGGFSAWTPWIKCSDTCGDGTRSRYRLCNNPPPQYGGAECNGDLSSFDACSIQKICPNIWCYQCNSSDNNHCHKKTSMTPSTITTKYTLLLTDKHVRDAHRESRMASTTEGVHRPQMNMDVPLIFATKPPV
ncbi:A disintegrin and metalloproteinase with thrombospondin motifs 14-like [Mya arenaria]|uniref:A disintegrin and metalloproteinase with thrombospondin motifs 14-like n=1 Tax=Mya arenaria TaxID=6604 RepID=UPI0022E762F6|nr:A disintegrin and metalloproteinase with thrombospondin motifs 14-like [Mya arenaria]